MKFEKNDFEKHAYNEDDGKDDGETMKIDLEKDFKKLEKSQDNFYIIIKNLGEKDYIRKMENYIDSLSHENLLKFAEEIKKYLVDNNSPLIKPYIEFGINPFVSDLTKHSYSHPITFSESSMFSMMGKGGAGAFMGGWYNENEDEVIVYIPRAEESVDKSVGADLQARLKCLFSSGYFGTIVISILHELVHREQRPSEKESEELDEKESKELREGQAFIEYFKKNRILSLAKRTKYLFSNSNEELEETTFGLKVKQYLDFAKKEVLRSFKLDSGEIDEELIQFFKKVLNGDKQSNDIFRKHVNRKAYQFSMDKLIVGLHIIDKLRALNFTEREIANIIGKYGDRWNNEKVCYPKLEQFISEKASGKGLNEDDLEDLTMSYKVNMRTDFNLALEKLISLMKKKLEIE